ncbi:MAG: 4Fe-4S binding protein [Deltaproteobacteria bacterium]|jgi:NADH-quinone oxidoreductase subunit F|nr:4Fe-4S binding protein [Deltaproteobacteria bacterium]
MPNNPTPNDAPNAANAVIDLEETRKRYEDQTKGYKNRVIVCAGTGCMANGSMKVYEAFVEIAKSRGIKADVALKKEDGDVLMSATGCQGFCQMGPLVTIEPQDILYTKVKAEDVEEIVTKTLVGGEAVERLLYRTPDGDEPVKEAHAIPFYHKQTRLLLKQCGSLDATDLDAYVAAGGYFMARKAVLGMTDKEICDEILASGLRGRGGGGFPTGKKWELTRVRESAVKYVICNGDEGDPGAFMDRCVMEGNPHAVLEGMIIAAKAIGATQGHIYVRMEYPLAVKRLRFAIEAAEKAGILGDGIFGSDMNFGIKVMEGAGAFVCGEETALIASIEGRRGMPTLKPPFPAESGLFGKPTLINNVETLATVPVVLSMGAGEYGKLGTANAKGTKTFALTGHVANTGLIEVPFGVTLREIVEHIGGGVVDDDGNLRGCDFKAVQIGGPSGGCLTQEFLDLPLDYDNLQSVGAMVGSGGLVVMNQNTCMVQIARFFIQFTQNESCGKCIVCREGTRQMLALLDDIVGGVATDETISLLEEVAYAVKKGSLCGLGKTAPNPVLSTLKYFKKEYDAHVHDKKCPVNGCEALMKYVIAEDLCKGCGLCARKCPVEAISGEKKKPYHIDKDKCVKCGVCVDNCKFDAIVRG